MKLLVRNLSRTTAESELKKHFEAFGMVQSCNIVKDASTSRSKGFGFVEMPRNGEAKAAMKTLNGSTIDGFKVRVKRAENKPKAAETPKA